MLGWPVETVLHASFIMHAAPLWDLLTHFTGGPKIWGLSSKFGGRLGATDGSVERNRGQIRCFCAAARAGRGSAAN